VPDPPAAILAAGGFLSVMVSGSTGSCLFWSDRLFHPLFLFLLKLTGWKIRSKADILQKIKKRIQYAP
jgi:hypothetical protein